MVKAPTYLACAMLAAVSAVCGSEAEGPRITGVTYVLGGGMCPVGEECSDRTLGARAPATLVLEDSDGAEQVILDQSEFAVLSRSMNSSAFKDMIHDARANGCPVAFDSGATVTVSFENDEAFVLENMEGCFGLNESKDVRPLCKVCGGRC